MRTGRPVSERYQAGDIVKSNGFGDFKVIQVNSARSILCESVNTGYRVIKQAQHLDTGSIKDPYQPSVLGVGYFGESKEKSEHHKKIYQMWRNMLTRCYCEKYQAKNPTYIGCKVADEWHNFQNFAKWVDNNPNFTDKCQIDKDILGDGTLYSPSTCKLVSCAENNEEAHCNKVKIVTPSGDVIGVYNVSKFARDHGLLQSHLSSVLSGKRKSHKGYTRCTN